MYVHKHQSCVLGTRSPLAPKVPRTVTPGNLSDLTSQHFLPHLPTATLLQAQGLPVAPSAHQMHSRVRAFAPTVRLQGTFCPHGFLPPFL